MGVHYTLRGRDVIPYDPVGGVAGADDFSAADACVGMTRVDESRVCTDFAGVDLDRYGDGPPKVFETMVFGGPLDQDTTRYATWAEAAKGHERVVARVRAAT